VIITTDQNINKENDKRYPKFANFGEYLFWSYANLQMLCAALNMGKAKYDKSCYMIRAKAFKAYIEGRWNIHDLLEFNVAKIKENNYCWYCGKEMEPSKLTKDHVFPKAKVGPTIWIISSWCAKHATHQKELCLYAFLEARRKLMAQKVKAYFNAL